MFVKPSEILNPRTEIGRTLQQEHVRVARVKTHVGTRHAARVLRTRRPPTRGAECESYLK